MVARAEGWRLHAARGRLSASARDAARAMTPGARIEAAIELLDEIRGGTRPADQVIDAYFKRRRYAGSGDRRAISERVYNLLRRRARIDWWIERTGLDGEPDTRRRLIADLALSDKSSPEQTAVLPAT